VGAHAAKIGEVDAATVFGKGKFQTKVKENNLAKGDVEMAVRRKRRRKPRTQPRKHRSYN